MANKIKAYTRAIMASKIFMSSRDKAGIIAAINDPVNKELVTQLAEYVDEEYEDLLVQAPDPAEDTDTEVMDEQGMEDTVPENTEPNDSPRPTPLSVKHGDALQDLDESMPPPDNMDDAVPDEPSEAVTDDATAATKVGGTSITADTSITPKESSVALAGIAGEIKGSLNARNDTSGVVRVLVKKDEEVWVYYADSINLNVVMEPVIRVLSSMGYYYLNFNRLARTDNAIVFLIDTNEA